ncbi:MAG: signal peptidase I, partial [Acidimicrobiales bacterium]
MSETSEATDTTGAPGGGAAAPGGDDDDGAGVPPAAGASHRRRRRGRGLVEWVAIIVLALLAAFVIKTWVLQAFVIPSGSMEPTIQPGDRVLVDKLAYDFHPVHRGDIIVFRKPAADTQSGDINDLIKRVIGLPGETLQSGPNGEILVDGRPIRQPWIAASVIAARQPTICDPSLSRVDCVGNVLHLPKGEYYVL